MPDFKVRADSVDVEQIMRQIRARIREKRGVDYTEEQVQELARVKLEKFLDPRGIRSDLLQEFRRSAGEFPPGYEYDSETLFDSPKAHVRFLRRLLRPLTRLLLNPINEVLQLQAGINRFLLHRYELSYELMHNLVLEVTRSSIEVKNMKMRVESLSSRLDFAERRARALEAVVQYQPEVSGSGATGARSEGRDAEEDGGIDPITGGQSVRTRRRRRRRGRRSGPGFSEPGSERSLDQESTPAADQDRVEPPTGRGEGDEPTASPPAAPATDSSPRTPASDEPAPGARTTDES